MAPLNKREKFRKQHRIRGISRKGIQLLRDFIIPNLDLGIFGKYLCWNGCATFKIVWLHKSSKKWNSEVCRVYLEWARMKNRLPSSFNEDDEAVKQKGALRSAFNKLEREGQLKLLPSAKDYRVYHIIGIEAIRADSSSAGSSAESSDDDLNSPDYLHLVSSESPDTTGDETSSDMEINMGLLEETVDRASPEPTGVEESCVTEQEYGGLGGKSQGCPAAKESHALRHKQGDDAARADFQGDLPLFELMPMETLENHEQKDSRDCCGNPDDWLNSYLENLSSQEINVDFWEGDLEDNGTNFKSTFQVQQQAGNNLNADFGLSSPPPAENIEEYSLSNEDIWEITVATTRQGPCSNEEEPSPGDSGLLNNSFCEKFMNLSPYLREDAEDPFMGYCHNSNKN